MERIHFIETVRLQNILSYGPDSTEFHLGPLNVLIGPNASGKSNFIEALSILAAAPVDIQTPFREGGGVSEWIWKGTPQAQTATVEATLAYRVNPKRPLRYRLSFTPDYQARFVLNDEVIEDACFYAPASAPKSYYSYRNGQPEIRAKGDDLSERLLTREDVKSDQSILSQVRDPMSYLELTIIGAVFSNIYFYREFPLGRSSRIRLPQQVDLPQHALTEDGSNLAVILNYLQNDPGARKRIQQWMQEFYPSIRHIHSRFLGGTVQVFFEEDKLNSNIPATRLSDGSLHFLCLLIALINPHTPSLICIEEPETGLHPDVIPGLAKLLVEASERSQIIVTTHSDILVDALSETPEAVVICEKVDGATQLRRLDADKLKIWLDKYRLGELWTRGQLGGNLW